MLRAERRTADGRRPTASAQPVSAPDAHAPAREPARPTTVPPPVGRAAAEPSPSVSVIVVCWNAEHVLERCLDQLLAQDYANFEIIVVDDGSQDDTLAIAERLARDGPVEIVRSPRNRGCPHARNLGLDRARGEVVAFIDADGYAAPDWLSGVVATLGADASVGGVASTVFFEANPLVVNGAGGIVNRQGWAADLSMNEPYERVEIVEEALYPMGCGMAVRRSAIERVGPFDDRMLNYYDDVDYGIRLWRAGYRVLVAPDAWIDHGFGASDRGMARRRLLCERHRMRVVLKHASRSMLARWCAQEALAVARADWNGRAQKLKAMGWNARHLASTLVSRRRLRRAAGVPDRLVDPSWGDRFPVGVPPLTAPRPEDASPEIDMADPDSGRQLLYGWFPRESVEQRSYRWAGLCAGGIVRLAAPARRLRLDYTHAPVDTGGVDVVIRSVGSGDPLAAVWSAHLRWQYIENSVENHPLTLPAGDYEVVFSARGGWTDPPRETRTLSFALRSLSFGDSSSIPTGGLDMASALAEEQLVSGWFELERSEARAYRWGGACCAAVIRLTASARTLKLSYRLPPGPTGGLRVTLRSLAERSQAWSTHLAWRDSAWRTDSFDVQLPAGDYLVAFDSEGAWSNPDQRDASKPPEERSLGFCLSSLLFGPDAP